MLNQNKKNILFHFPNIHLPHNLIKNKPHLRNLLIPSQAQIFYILCKLKYFMISLCKLTTLSRSLSFSLLKYFTFLHENKIKAITQVFPDGLISLLQTNPLTIKHGSAIQVRPTFSMFISQESQMENENYESEMGCGKKG